MRSDTDSRMRRLVRRDRLKVLAPALAIAVLAVVVTLRFVKPAPPRQLVLAYTPNEGGARYFARKYQDFLKKNGIALELRETDGSLTNLDLISHESDVSVAFVEGGTPPAESAGAVVSLGSLTYTPLWIATRGAAADDVIDLKGKRVAAGHPLSGTRALLRVLLKATGSDEGTQLLPLDRDAGLAQLEKSEIDAVVTVAPAEAPAIKKMAASANMKLLSFARADAYTRRFPYLKKLVLPRGVFDLAADVPSRDVVLVAPTLNLLARDTLHPALAYLMMRAATEIHGAAGLLDAAGEFPAPLDAGFPLSAQARRYYQSGAPLLQKYLPFWAANLVDRLWVMLVPIIAVLLPMGRILPAMVRWRVRSRVFRWYSHLKEIELQLDDEHPRDTLDRMLTRLDELEQAVKRIPTPLAYADNLYFFREHVDVVRRRIVRRREEQG